MEQVAALPAPNNSSKVYIRFFDYIAKYEIDRALPSVLDSAQNGGTRTGVTENEWLAFCDKIDSVFKNLNTLQGINFYCDIIIGAVVILYVVLSFLVFVVKIKIQIVYAILGLAFLNTVLHAYVRGPANTAAIHDAKRLCETETARMNLRAGHEAAIQLVFHYRKRSCWNCEGYEFDSNQKQRYHEIFVQVTVRGPEAIEIGDTTTITATVVDDYFNTANAPIATATEISAATYTNGRQEGAPYEPYVTPPMASAQVLNAGETEERQATEGEPPQ